MNCTNRGIAKCSYRDSTTMNISQLTQTDRSVCNTRMPRSADITRSRLVDAAFAEIHSNGFRAASIAAILDKLGLTKGAFYHHFANKKELGLAVIDERIAPLLDDSVMRPLREGQRPILVLLDLLENGRSANDDDVRLGCPLNNLMQEMSSVDDDFRRHLAAILERWRASILSVLLHSQKNGEIRPDVDCQACALFIVAAWEGGAGISKNLRSADPFRSTMAQLRIFVEGLFVARYGALA